MAKIVVLSMAYRGDVHPYVPVASELARRGHDVTFVVPREFHDELSGEPFDCVHSGSDFGPAELNKHGDWLAKWGMRFGGARLLELYFGTFTVPHLESQFTAINEALDGADVLFTHSTAVSPSPRTSPTSEGRRGSMTPGEARSTFAWRCPMGYKRFLMPTTRRF